MNVNVKLAKRFVCSLARLRERGLDIAGFLIVDCVHAR